MDICLDLLGSKVEQREVGLAFTHGPCFPIIHCTPLASLDLVAEPKWRRENPVTKFVKLRMQERFFNLTGESISVSR